MIKIIFVVAISLAIGFPANAKTRLNSMCYVLAQSGAQIEGPRSDELFEIASVSKVVTAYWAVRILGPYFRFQTRIHITPVDQKLFDVHIQGDKDPFWGRQLTHFLFSELNRNGVSAIRHLTFDENLTFRWSVLTDYILPSSPTIEDVMKSLRRHITHLESEYPQTRKEAASAGIHLSKRVSLEVQNVEFLPSTSFQPIPQTRSYVLKSAPLHHYLKEMNVVSNNHVADRLFDYLGGPGKFKSFIQQDIQMDDRHIRFINGSGDSLISKNDKGLAVKVYNKASCETMIRIMIKLDTELKSSKLRLRDVMAVSGSDKSTLNPRFDSLQNSLVAKTGTVDPAITLAGVLSTVMGDVYFGVFIHTQGAGDWGRAKDQVREKVFELMQKFKGRRAFEYTSRNFLPFDQESGLDSLETSRSLAVKP